ncbi:hypothetical protein BOTBODRAFT_30978 [Botryobasidium botryosum FD-172 SS1]|uniref:AB hydrolase-1 domain-containing protein n=1 Tax=Botryobasidium botryosum (strain FD-172 SS1) TaxID=930990 RepID=A0A067MNI5_BOTB1|nr:hypothetical protein BOTBODRAFT_30978 [Botryobasidium botryosum FD-172 SS1]
MAATPPVSEGTIPFTVDGETHQTWFKVFGDPTNRTRTPIVVLHGGPGYSHDYLIPIADLAKSSYTVIFYDQIGNARSTHLPGKPPSFWNIDLFIDELVNVLEHFKVQDGFSLVGHSWGAMLATEYEIRRKPAGLKRLVVSNSAPAIRLYFRSLRELGFPEEAHQGSAPDPHVLLKHREAFNQFAARHFCTVQPMPAEFEYSIGQCMNDGSDLSVSSAMLKGELNAWDIIDQLHHVRVPTLVINGRDDTAQDYVCAPFFWKIPKAKWVTFGNSSHTSMWEEREKYMKVLDEFLSD